MSARTKPPFRADHVGSILRSAAIHSARTKAAKGEITAAELKAVEDREIEGIIKKQEEIGLQLATDGEYRRSWWHLDFCWGLTGCEKITLPHGIKFHGVETRPEGYRITGKLDFPPDHPMLEHFRFLKAHTKVMPKMCIPAPPVLHFRLPKDGIPKSAYANMHARSVPPVCRTTTRVLSKGSWMFLIRLPKSGIQSSGKWYCMMLPVSK